jgi:tight adherence protein B
VFLGVLVLALALAAPAFRSSRSARVESIEQYVTRGERRRANQPGAASASGISTSLVSFGDKVMEGRDSTTKTMALIERADLPLRPGEWWVLRIVAVVVASGLAVFLLGGGTVATALSLLLGLVLGALLPAMVLKFLAKRRCKKFEAQLPDVLFLLASSLSTGFSLLQALDAVAKDSPQPAAKEFSRALAETRIGADISDALENVGERMDSVNMRWTAMAIRIQRTVGGNLAETLKTTGKTLREREELGRHVRALSAEGRLSAYILIALPVGMFFYLNLVNKEYVSLLWTETIGIFMMVAGLISLGVGVLWMRKTVEVKV